jgi:BMFP domain-containing protein YqiC
MCRRFYTQTIKERKGVFRMKEIENVLQEIQNEIIKDFKDQAEEYKKELHNKFKEQIDIRFEEIKLCIILQGVLD